MEENSSSLNEILSHNLRLIYALRKQSLEEFSRELGIGHTTLQNILQRRGNPTLETVELIAKGLNISPLELLSQRYSKTNLVCASLLLDSIELFRPMPAERRGEAIAQFCQLVETITQET